MGFRFDRSLKCYIRCVLDVIYGRGQECILCSDYAEELLCSSCTEKVRFSVIEGRIEKFGLNMRYYSCAYYSSVVKEMIIRLKYKSDFNCGVVLAQLLVRLVEEKFKDVPYAAYVPSDVKSLKKRGYNQSKFLCQELCRYTDKTMLNCLVKNRGTKDQIGLSGEARWNNLEGAFVVKDADIIKGKSIILIDDVITTGATAYYCKRAMMDAGCREVIILTVAKSTV